MRFYMWTSRLYGHLEHWQEPTSRKAKALHLTLRDMGYLLGPIVVVDLPEPGRKKGKKK